MDKSNQSHTESPLVEEHELASSARRRLLLGGSAAGLTGLAPVAGAQNTSDVAAAESGGISRTKGKSLTVNFEGKRCIHARFCVLESPAVFLANVSGPWIKPDAESAENLMHTIRQCPSGALTYDRHDGGPAEPMPPVNLVRIRENGPLAIHAEMNLKGAGKMQRATLCRCGASKNKPYCDGAHKDAKFTASGEAPVSPDMKPLPKRNGVLNIEPLADGPLLVNGNMEVVTGTGASVARLTTTILCRCGQSKNKPFCDGTHASVGFKAPA